MKRREFITFVGGAAVTWPLAATAQRRDQMWRVGIMMSLPETDPEAERRLNAIRTELQARGWSETSNLHIDVRWAVGAMPRQQVVAKELVELRPDIIFVQSTIAATAVLKETREISIVFVQITDPLGQGFVESLARPGGNITGFSNFETEIGGKWLQLLKEIAPQLGRVAVIFNPETAPYSRLYVGSLENAAHSFSVKMTANPVRNVTEIEPLISSLGNEPPLGLIFPPDTFTSNHRKLINDLALRYRLPAIYAVPYIATEGGLLSYGPDIIALIRQACTYVDRILKGAKPGDLPIQQPTKFELVINLKTAKALGFEVPLFLQQRADQLIE